MAGNVWVPRVVVSCEGLAVHHLADAASQGVHAEDAQLTLRWDLINELTFSVQHLLAGRGYRKMHIYVVDVGGYIWFVCVGDTLVFTSIFMVKPLRVTLLEKAVVSGTVSNWKGERVGVSK